MRSRHDIHEVLTRVRAGLAIAAVAVAACVLVGWLANLEVLKRGILSSPPMKANAAISLVALAFALFSRRELTDRRWRAVGTVAATLTALLALATLGEYAFGWKLGIDQLLFSDHARVDAPYPGRPAFNAALAFVLLAAAILALDIRAGRWWLSHALAGLAGGLGLLALVGAATGTRPLVELVGGQSISVPAAVGIVALGAGVLLARLDRGVVALFASPSAGGVLLRRLWPFALAIPLGLAALRLAGQNAGLYGERDGEWLYASALTVIFAVFAWQLARVIERESAERGSAAHALLALSESASDAVVMADAKGAIRYINRGAEAMFGCAPRALEGEPLAVLFAADWDAQPLADIERETGGLRGAAGGRPDEVRVRRRDGSELAAEVSWTVSAAPGGERTLTGIFRDVSLRKRVENRFRRLLDSAPDAIVIVDSSEQIVLVNARTEALLGYAREELLGQPVTQLMAPRFAAALLAPVPEGHADVDPSGVGRLVYAVRRDGEEFPAEVSRSRMLTEEGTLALISIRDVTERVRAEHARAWLAAIVESSSEAVVGVSREGLVESWNAGAERLYGWSSAEAVGRPMTMFMAPEVAGQRAELHQRVLDGHPVVDFETADVTSDGRRIDVLVNAAAIRDATGKTIGVARIARDITDRKRLEQAQKLEAIGQLAGGIAHDFNNLLTIVSGYARRLRDRADLASAHRDLDQIVSASDRAAELTRQLLTFSRRGQSEPELIDINATIRALEPMLRRLIEADIVFDFELGRGVPAALMDATELEQILMNLIINASHAMAADGGTLTVATWPRVISDEDAALHDAKPGDAVCVSIADTGVGIAPAVRDRIFEPFFTTKGEKGTGMGLATAYGVVQQAGGWIDVESELGVGTTFRVVLPAGGPPSEPEPDATDEDRATLLLVEDETALRSLVVAMLEEQGYHVLQAGNGPDAIALAERHRGPLDLLITDVVMPRLSGAELASTLRAIRPGLEVLFMSGYSDNQLLSRGVAEGTVNLLVKPFTPAQLYARIRELIPAVHQD